LHIMQERALLIGAELSITETPTGGLSVSVRLPGGDASQEPTKAEPVHARVGA
jgi:nitrate/nitrite-specific signal transduction histidine kinase